MPNTTLADMEGIAMIPFLKYIKEPAPGDATAKTKPSKHTLKYREMFGEVIMDRVKQRT